MYQQLRVAYDAQVPYAMHPKYLTTFIAIIKMWIQTPKNVLVSTFCDVHFFLEEIYVSV